MRSSMRQVSLPYMGGAARNTPDGIGTAEIIQADLVTEKGVTWRRVEWNERWLSFKKELNFWCFDGWRGELSIYTLTK